LLTILAPPSQGESPLENILGDVLSGATLPSTQFLQGLAGVVRKLTIVDEFTRECLAIDVARNLTSEDVLERLSDLFGRRGVPDHIRSDNGNGSEFTAKRVREWLERVGLKTLSIEPGSPWGNGYVESFNGKLRDELLDRKVFDTLLEAKVLIGRWRKAYNTVRPHSSLGYRPPAPEDVS